MTALAPIRPAPVPVRAHTRRRRPDRFYETHSRLRDEIVVERALAEWAEEFPEAATRALAAEMVSS